jgi:predicted RNase H-related nuclease YkuK (DUF458 family)
MFSDKELQGIFDYINNNPEAKIYLGCDSLRSKHKKVKFVTVLVVYQKDKSKIFKNIIYEKITDAKLSRPFNRMMREVQSVTELYMLLEDVLIYRDFEIHIDVSPDPINGSNVAYNSAKGMVYGMTGVEPVCKPDSWAASHCADRFTKDTRKR